jgi:hypothetical protein
MFFYSSGDNVSTDWIGYGAAPQTGLVFSGVDIPPGATITSATIKCYGFGYNGTPFNEDPATTRIEGFAEDSAAVFMADGTNRPSSRDPSTQYVEWSGPWTFFFQWLETPDLSQIVQEIIDRPGWASGNNLGFRLSNPSGKGTAWRLLDYSSGFNNGLTPTTLQVSYIIPEQIVISGGPTHNPPGGGSFTPALLTPPTQGTSSFTWNNLNPAAVKVRHLYFGIKNVDVSSPGVIGDAMDTTGPTGAEIFTYSSNTSNSITYSGATQIWNSIQNHGFQTVATRNVITFTGVGTLIQDARTKALKNSNGDVHGLWEIAPGQTSFSVAVSVQAYDGSNWIPASSYFDATRTRDGVDKEIDSIDLGFYYDGCGDGKQEGDEECDEGSDNGKSTSCCDANCKLVAAGTVCGPVNGECDLEESCTGAAGSCPPDAVKPVGTMCSDDGNACTTDQCDGTTKVCQHAAGNAGAVCRASTVCDAQTGTGCCDVAETCTGNSADCPPDSFAASTVECRKSTAPCDAPEFCTGVGSDCPADTFKPGDDCGILFGGDILARLSSDLGRAVSWDDVDWDHTVLPDPSTNQVIKLPHAKLLIAGAAGPLQITWRFKDASVLRSAYNVSSLPAKTPMVIYHTHQEDGTAEPDMPMLVDFTARSIPKVKIHYNVDIPCTLNPTDCAAANPGTSISTPSYLWVAGGKLAARKETGLVILEYENSDPPTVAADFLGYEIVQVKEDATDVGDTTVDVGSRLRPTNPVAGATAYLRQGGAPDNLIFQNNGFVQSQPGEVWAVATNNDPFKMQVVWKRTGVAGVVWPFEIHRYASTWPTDPTKYQLYVRGAATAPGLSVVIPPGLNVSNPPYYQEPSGNASIDSSGNFSTLGPGWTLLRYKANLSPGVDWMGFEVVRSVLHSDSTQFDLGGNAADIGAEITDSYHQGPRPGYIYAPEGTRYAPEVYGATGQIFAVNTDPGKALEVWWSNLSRTVDPEGPSYPAWPSDPGLRVQWPSKVIRYLAQWPSGADPLVIAAQDRDLTQEDKHRHMLDPATYGTDWVIYGGDGSKNDPTKPGFNPNDEHALQVQGAVYALRDDLGTPNTSDGRHVLLQYKEQQPTASCHDAMGSSTACWRFKLLQVKRESSPYFLHQWTGVARSDDPYKGEAGPLIQSPFPLSTLPNCPQTMAVSGPAFRDREGLYWAKAAGDDGVSTADITMHYYYPVQPGFDFPTSPAPPVGTCLPWLDNGSGTPADVTMTISWPPDCPDPDPNCVPKMNVGATLIEANKGLPQINGQCSVDVVYQQSDPTVTPGGTYTKPSVSLIDPVRTRSVTLAHLPGDIKIADGAAGTKVFTDLSLALRLRLSYDPAAQKLSFTGLVENPVTGSDFALLDVMSMRDLTAVRNLSNDQSWKDAVNALGTAAENPVFINNSDTDSFDKLALTTGLAQGTGYVTLAMQNANKCRPLPVGLNIIKVVPQLDAGQIAVITPPCPFDEKLTLTQEEDFAGHPENYQFDWRYGPDDGGMAPPGPFDTWTAAPMDRPDGIGDEDVTIHGASLLTLSDNWFVSRYKYVGPNHSLPWYGQWSSWTPPQLAPGWIKRVVGDVNPFEQRATGGGIQGAENQFFSYRDTTVNTIVSMISQAGPRWEGNVPLNCNGLDGFGLLQIYETVLGRGRQLSIDGDPAVDYAPADQALLLVASRIADLYMLLGNEAYSDAEDPTIAFTTDDKQYGTEASSIHTFQNQTSSMIEEELDLLRGRDNSAAPGVQVAPVYNRLFWNFTNGQDGGEAAYVLNYDIQDELGNKNGAIDVGDAEIMYPQGHGDAWGHYLTGINTYYQLLRHPNYTWQTRAEGVLVGGTPVTVDYMDERKFASIAAARARTGAEVVNLTYRQAYVEDPAGQWQGYQDTTPGRAWGVADWESRAGQAAYFDWVTGNAVLPAVDPDPTHTGIQKIDRTTVLDLREVASRFQDIQAQADTADQGLNPLGLATNVVPFDIDPTQIDMGKTHFEQIYDRAVAALNNAVTVFNHANNSTRLLREQSDSLADFQQKVTDQESDFKNRLIESLGYPYADDIGPTGTYPSGYDGPDIYHYSYVDVSDLLGVDPGATTQLSLTLENIQVQPDGSLQEQPQTVVFHISGNGYGEVKPATWTGQRRAPGEIQMARSDLLQARVRFDQALANYDNLLSDIDDQAASLAQQEGLNATEINILNTQLNQQRTLDQQIADSRRRQLEFRSAAANATLVANALAEFLPTDIGLSEDATAPARGAIRLQGSVLSQSISTEADQESLTELDQQQAQQEMQAANSLTLTALRNDFTVQEKLRQLEETVRHEVTSRLDLYNAREAMIQAEGKYQAALATGERLLEERDRFRQQTAANIQGRRYKDMAFRIFRDDALQKYRAQFDLAARYVYLAAKAYDFETTLLNADAKAGSQFLTDIVKERLIGDIEGGLPHTGVGLSNPMAVMSQDFSVVKSQLGFNNPQQETTRFSLRSELFRIQKGPAGDAVWRETLRRYVVPNLNDVDEFQRYARFVGGAVEPAIVIPFTTDVELGINFFGWPLGGGDSAYDPSHFATKVRSVGTWFSNYPGTTLSQTPRVYLIPVGSDTLRTPSEPGQTRQFNILDQQLPLPFPIGNADLNNPDWIPTVSTTPNLSAVQHYSAFRAYQDSGTFTPTQVERTDSRAIGRSVWNTRWLLVIPAGYLSNDRNEGINQFIDGQVVNGQRNGNGVSDILIFFETYAYSGR